MQSTSNVPTTSADELASMAESLKDTVSFFTLDETEVDSKLSDLHEQMLKMAEAINILNNKKEKPQKADMKDLKKPDKKEEDKKGIILNLAERKDDQKNEFDKF